MFFVVVTLVLVGLSIYVVRRSSQAFGLSKRTQRVLLGVTIGALAALTGIRLARRALPDGVAEPIGVVMFAVALSFLMSAILLLAFWEVPALAARLVAWAHGRVTFRRAPATTPPERSDLTDPGVVGGGDVVDGAVVVRYEPAPAAHVRSSARRVFLQQAATGSALALGGSAATYGAVFGRHDYVLEEVPVQLDGLPRALDGFTLVQLSDLHIGTFVSEDAERAGTEMVQRARPNVIVLTGDLVDHDPRYASRLGRWIERLGEIAPVVAIAGNHDYYAGIQQVAHAIQRAGATLLDNRGLEMGDDGGRFALLGVDDVWAKKRYRGRGPDLQRALATVPRDLPRVLLCHNPAFFPEAAGEVGLMLSGHTHGGQVNLGVRPADYVLPYGYVAGLYERGGSTLYVNRGFGTAGPPARVQAAPEVSKIVLIA